MMWLDVILVLAGAMLLVPALVFFAECALAILPGASSSAEAAAGARPRCAILVPAHNEALGIKETLEGLLPELAEGDRLVVVADNCSDDTAAIARGAGAMSIERHDAERRGKGYALVFGLDYLKADPPDVVVVVDADCRVTPGAIEQLARKARDNGRPAQAEYLIISAANTPGTMVSALSFLVKNKVRPRGLHRLGLPVHLTGSGMAFPWRVIREAPATEGYIVEDLLIGIELALMGRPPLFCPEARVTSLLPERGKTAMEQRRRWEHGHLQTLFGQGPRLIVAGLVRRAPGLLALGLDLFVPPLAFLVLTICVLVVLSSVAVLIGASPYALVLPGAALALVSAGVAGSWLKFGRTTLPLRHLLAVPRYVLWKIPLYLSFFLRGRQRTWERTERSPEVVNGDGAAVDGQGKVRPCPTPVACHRNGSPAAMRVMFALPGLHRVNRGAEVAFESIAQELATHHGSDVTLIGSGTGRVDRSYRFLHVGCVPRQRFRGWPQLPLLRHEYAYEELTFAFGLRRAYRPDDYDVTVACSFPYTNWVLRGGRRNSGPAHVFVTQNGDWPAWADNKEFRFFRCDGLVCTNPEYYERNRDRWTSELIPNGVDPEVFKPGPADRSEFGLPGDAPVALMVSALHASKRVREGIRCAARVPALHLVVAGEGPLRREIEELGRSLMGRRFTRIAVARERMPALYRAADVFLHMSIDEPSANAYMEALATGLPIVTHDRSVTRWMLTGTGVLVDTTDESAVVEGIRCGLELAGNAQVAARRDLVQRRFCWRHIAGEYRAFFERVLEQRA